MRRNVVEGKVWHRVDEAATCGDGSSQLAVDRLQFSGLTEDGIATESASTPRSEGTCSETERVEGKVTVLPRPCSDVWQLKDLKFNVFGSAAMIGLTGAFSGSAARRGLSGFGRRFTNEENTGKKNPLYLYSILVPLA